MTAELVLRWAGGSIDMMGWNEGAYGDYEVATLADGTNWGSPESVRRKLRSAMLDGSRSTKERDDNRTIPLKLRVSAADHSALAGGEQALDLIDGRRCELVWTPPGTLGIAPSVFVVDFAELHHEMDDLGYARGELLYTLTLDCLPHAYSDEWVEVPALPQSVSVRTEFDTCDTLSGWSSAGVTVADAGDFIQIAYPDGVNSGTVTRSGVVDFTADRYLSVTHSSGSGVGQVVAVDVMIADSWARAARVSTEGNVSLYDVGASVTAIRFSFERPPVWLGAINAAQLTSLGRQATVRAATSNGQVRTIQVPGSRRTPALVQVVAPDSLGDVIAYSGPDYDPSLATRLAPGSPGHQVTTAAPTTLYKWPVWQLPPGDYVAWASMETGLDGGAGSSATVEFKAELHRTAGLVRSSILANCTFAHGLADEVMPLFAATLPPWGVPEGSPLQFGLRATLTSGSGTVAFPWLWLFNVTSGQLMVARAGSERFLRMEPPSLDRDSPVVSFGSTEEGIPASLSSELAAWGGSPFVAPPYSTLYTWSSGPTPINSVSARLRPAWHTHPPALS